MSKHFFARPLGPALLVILATGLTLVISACERSGEQAASVATPQELVADPQPESLETVETGEVLFAVTTLHCESCVANVRGTLAGIEGVLEADVTLEPPRARVQFDPTQVDVDDIIEAIKATGFTASVIPDEGS